MRYYLMEQDAGYTDIPKPLDWFKIMTCNNSKKSSIDNISNREIFYMKVTEQTVFPDILCYPLFMVSRKIKDCLMLYEPNLKFKEIILLDQNKRIFKNYFMTELKQIDCLTSNSEYTFAHAELKKIELDQFKIKDRTIFEIKGPQKKYIVARLDTVESILRRGNPAVSIRELPCVCARE